MTSRDRAVTAADFETIAKQASGEVARAACSGEMGGGTVEVVVLRIVVAGKTSLTPSCREGFVTMWRPTSRGLINVSPVVRLALFRPVDISVTLRLRPNANVIHVRGSRRHGSGPSSTTRRHRSGRVELRWNALRTGLARMVSDIHEVRHVSEVSLYGDLDEGEKPIPGWEKGGGVELRLDGADLFRVMRVESKSRMISGSANTLQRYGHLPPHRSTGDYAYLEQVVRIGFPVLDARAFLRRHLGNQVGYRLVEAKRGEEPGQVRAIEVHPQDGGSTVNVLAERTLPDGTPASYYTPEDLVEIRARIESEFGGPVSPLQPRDKIILHVRSRLLSLLAWRLSGAAPTHREASLRRRSVIRQWGGQDEVTVTQVGRHERISSSLPVHLQAVTTIATIDGLPQMTNPMVVDPKFLPWLASWVDFSWMKRCPCISNARLLRRSIHSPNSGHERGHAEMIRVLTVHPLSSRSIDPASVLGRMTLAGGRNIEERYLRHEPPGHFLLKEGRKSSTFFVLRLESQDAFRKRFGERASAVLRRIAHIVTREKPAHVSFTLQFDEGRAA